MRRLTMFNNVTLVVSADIADLPRGQAVWRASNALSWLAGNTSDGRRRMELERVAGEVI